VLPGILDGVKDADPRIAFCIATDGNGYVPVHNREYSKPQRPDDPAWNTANCRNRRIFDDRAGILAARSQRSSLVQAYRRDLGGGRFVTLKEFDAPIVIAGRHWGAIRLAVKP
jgi:methyl-accepting chemotaxis protein